MTHPMPPTTATIEELTDLLMATDDREIAMALTRVINALQTKLWREKGLIP